MSETLEKPPPAGPTVGDLRSRFTPADMIEKALLFRDKIAEIKKRQTQELEPLRSMLELLEAALMEGLNEDGADSIKCEAGTAYKTTRTSATVDAWSDTLDYIRDKEAWELLEARVSKTAALEIMKEIQGPIPGVRVTTEVALNIRRS